MADIDVSVSSNKSSYDFGERIELEIKVANLTSQPLYLAEPTQGHVYVQLMSSTEIHGLVGVPPHPYNLYYYGFLMPDMPLLNPNSSELLRKTIGMPILEPFINPDDQYDFRQLDVSGSVVIQIVVGYLKGFPIFTSAHPWGEFLTAQELSDPSTVTVTVAPPGP